MVPLAEDFPPAGLQALSVRTSCLEFGPNDCRVVLKLRHVYVPKVLFAMFRAQVITLSALPASKDEQDLHLICPVWALRMYVEHSALFRQSEQLFVCFSASTKGHKIEIVPLDSGRSCAGL